MSFNRLIFFWLHTVINFRLSTASNTTEEACLHSIPTISIVDHCPKDFSEWMVAKERKQCHWISQKCTKPERFAYHCLPDRYHKQFIEVCAPTKWIVGENCPYYNMEKHVIEPNYNHPCKGQCPQYYCSSSVYEYQECFGRMQKKSTNDKNEENVIYVKGDNQGCNQPINFLLIILVVLLCLHLCFRLYEKCQPNGFYRCLSKKSSTENDEESEELKLEQNKTEHFC